MANMNRIKKGIELIKIKTRSYQQSTAEGMEILRATEAKNEQIAQCARDINKANSVIQNEIDKKEEKLRELRNLFAEQDQIELSQYIDELKRTKQQRLEYRQKAIQASKELDEYVKNAKERFDRLKLELEQQTFETEKKHLYICQMEIDESTYIARILPPDQQYKDNMKKKSSFMSGGNDHKSYLTEKQENPQLERIRNMMLTHDKKVRVLRETLVLEKLRSRLILEIEDMKFQKTKLENSLKLHL